MALEDIHDELTKAITDLKVMLNLEVSLYQGYGLARGVIDQGQKPADKIIALNTAIDILISVLKLSPSEMNALDEIYQIQKSKGHDK